MYKTLQMLFPDFLPQLALQLLILSVHSLHHALFHSLLYQEAHDLGPSTQNVQQKIQN